MILEFHHIGNHSEPGLCLGCELNAGSYKGEKGLVYCMKLSQKLNRGINYMSVYDCVFRIPDDVKIKYAAISPEIVRRQRFEER